jgi:hypothetical protein
MIKREREVEVGAGIAAGEKRPHKPYKKPQLTVYGKVAELTAGVGGSNMDSGQSNNTKLGKG